MRRAIRILILTFLFAVLAGVAAADDFHFYISPDGEFTADAIAVQETGSKRRMFLPGEVNLEDMKIGFVGADSVTLNGKAVRKGDPATLLRLKNDNVITVKSRRTLFKIMQGSPQLPAVYITTKTNSLAKIHHTKNYKEPAYLVMKDGQGQVIFDGDLEHMKMRGNSSTKFGKKNYQIKLDKGTDLLGMGKAKKWILTGNWMDKSMIRNEMSFDLAEYIGIPFTPQHQQVELYVNHEYIGLYLFSEKVEINKNRIAIKDLEKETEALNDPDLSKYKRVRQTITGKTQIRAFDIPNNPEDITGGYLLEFEFMKSRYRGEPSGFITKKDIPIVIKSPEYASAEQVRYIAKIMQGFENAICASDGVDPVTGKHYSEFVDKNSLVRKYLLNEFVKNYDGNSSSEYFYKPADSDSELVYAGPVWDLDNSFGDYAREHNKKTLLAPTGFYISSASKKDSWWANLYARTDFYEAVVDCYQKEFHDAVEIILGQKENPGGKLKSLDAYQAAIEKSAEMNYVLYPRLKLERGKVQTGETFQKNIEYLRTYITARTQFLDKEWLGSTNKASEQ